MDSQAAIDGLRSCASSTYTNSLKEHNGNYWNDFADFLANSAHQSDEAFLFPEAIITSAHTVRLVYADVTCESNPRRLFKTYYQATYMQDLLALKRFQFTLSRHASRHFTFKFKVFLDDLPLLEKLKVIRPDLYIEILTCHSCCLCKEDLMHLILCSKRRNVMHQILQSYQNHLFSKLREAGELADMDPTPMLRKLSSLSC
ncbi:hypothetical protein RclHR1_35850002 [Rhizophagus clarus]|uniref:Uncharacterized protein n=1 Tax=Rhizophagus clarus TaxID=94130 RepID=A0A2Z6RSW2_9GLOM|nr:hypothetical protein RclHR1_35850002 [Rhizophagus clarus]